jgi:hypothetical protein
MLTIIAINNRHLAFPASNFIVNIYLLVFIPDRRNLNFWTLRSVGSSVSIVSSYRLDDRAFGIGSPAEAKEFSSSLCVQISSVAHPTFYPMGTGSFPAKKHGWGVMLTTHSHLVPRSRMSRSYTSSPPWSLFGVAGLFYFYLYLGLHVDTVILWLCCCFFVPCI